MLLSTLSEMSNNSANFIVACAVVVLWNSLHIKNNLSTIDINSIKKVINILEQSLDKNVSMSQADNYVREAIDELNKHTKLK